MERFVATEDVKRSSEELTECGHERQRETPKWLLKAARAGRNEFEHCLIAAAAAPHDDYVRLRIVGNAGSAQSGWMTETRVRVAAAMMLAVLLSLGTAHFVVVPPAVQVHAR
jgi:hypothetical protein